jgi:D-sedoheptulose 7-phosphate isomerase
MHNWNNKINQYVDILGAMSISLKNGEKVGNDEGFLQLREILFNVRNHRKTVYAVGNGASASMASHFSADLAKNGKLHTQVFSDLSLITAISNDLGYDEVFAEPLRRRGAKGDLLAAISSSGNSPNILNAVKTAQQIGITIVTLSAMDENNKLRQMGDFNIYIPAKTYGDAESCHAAILHYWIDTLA